MFIRDGKPESFVVSALFDQRKLTKTDSLALAEGGFGGLGEGPVPVVPGSPVVLAWLCGLGRALGERP